MSSFNAPRAPNVSQYLANLNRISPQNEPAIPEDLLNDASLSGLENLEFFDFDQFNPDDFNNASATAATAQQQNPRRKASTVSEMPMHTPHNYNFPDIPAYHPQQQTPQLHGPYPQHSFAVNSPNPSVGDKRKAGVAQIPSPSELEETSRLAAEEDKRRRNTAASARFRVKKKQREQALEKQAKEMTDRVTELENRVKELEQENKWLRELITDKKVDSASKAAAKGAHKEEKEIEKSSAQSSRTGSKDGVGTDDPEIDDDDDDDDDDDGDNAAAA